MIRTDTVYAAKESFELLGLHEPLAVCRGEWLIVLRVSENACRVRRQRDGREFTISASRLVPIEGGEEC